MLYVWSKLSSQKWADAWEERFSGGVQGSLVITTVPGRTMIRVELYCEKEKVALAVQKEFGGSVRKVKQQNWIALSAELPPPVKVRESLVICAARTKAEMVAARKEHAGREVIGVPADMAFGTGHHATTATVLRLLVDESERYAKQGLDWTMGDLGCGSGILAIAARKLGAKSAWGCDFDPKAVQVSKENGSRNGVPEVIFEEVDVLKWKPKKAQCWDVVAANLFADILENAFPTILKVMKPGGVVFLSGILHTQADECLRAGEAAGLVIERRIKIGKWVTAIGRMAAKNAMQDCKAKK